MKVWHFILLFLTLQLSAQEGFELRNRSKITIPFRQINNLSFVEVKVNGVPLTFLLDTGVAETILFSLENKSLDFKNVEKVRFTGLGKDQFVEGLKSTQNKVEIGRNYSDPNHEIYIILDEEFNFSSHVGIPVNGIMGYHFFKNNPVKIDFVRHKLTVYRDAQGIKRKVKKHDKIQLTIEGKKPYLTTEIELNKQSFNTKMLLDLGNSDAVWLFTNQYADFEIPKNNFEDFLGRGFNGDIYGRRSRTKSVKIGKNRMLKPVTSFPDSASIAHMNFVENRVGSIGSAVLKKFNMVIDYKNKSLYLRPNKFFNEPFKFNMSGLDIRHEGVQWERDLIRLETQPYKDVPENSGAPVTPLSEYRYKFVLKPLYSIANVRKNSPGAAAGLLTGDLLLEIDNKRTTEMDLQYINSLFMSEENRQVKVKVQRGKTILYKSLFLKDPIPTDDL